jgi:hypothetical protein
MPERVQHDLSCKNIVAQAIVPPPQAPLSFAPFQASELFDLVLSATVVGIVAENLNQFFEGAYQCGVFPADRSEFPLERGRGEDSKRSGHDVLLLSLLLFLAPAARSFQFSHEFARTAGLPASILGRACLYLFLYRTVLHFEIVLKIIDVHESGDGDAVLFQDKEFTVHVHASHDLTEMHARFGQRKPIHDGFHMLI